MKHFCKFISDHMGVLGHLKPRLINPLLGVIMFGMGLTLRTEDFKVVFSRPRDVITYLSKGDLALSVGMPALSTLAICIIVLIVIAANAHKLLDGGLVVLLVVVLHNVFGPGALFSVWHNVSGAIVAWLFGRKKP